MVETRFRRVVLLFFRRGFGSRPFRLEMRDQPGQRVVPARQHQILGQLSRLRGDLVPGQHFAWIDDGRVEPGFQTMGEEDRIENGPRRFGQAEADVGNAQDRHGAGELFLDLRDSSDGLDRRVLVLLVAGREREGQHVEEQLPGLQAVLQGPLIDAPRHLQLALLGQRHSLFVDGHRHRAGAVLLQEGKEPVDLFPAALEVDAVDDAHAGQPFQRRRDHLRLGGVDAERRLDLAGEQPHHPRHRLDFVGALGERHADVERVRSSLHLLAGDGENAVVVVAEEQLLHLAAALRIDPLADEQRPRFLLQRRRLQSAGEHRHPPRRLARRRRSAHGLDDGFQMSRRRAAAAAHDGEAEVADEARQVFGEVARRQRIMSHSLAILRYASVRLAAQRQRRVLGERPQRVDHLLGTGRAIEPHDVRAGGAEQRGGGKRLGAEQHAARGIERDLGDERHAPPHFLLRLARPEELRAQLEQVLRGLGDQAIDAPLQERDGLLAKDLDELAGPDAAQVGIARGGQEPARPERAGDEARPSVAALGLVRLGASNARRGEIHFVELGPEIELVQLGPAGSKSIGLDGVAARLEVSAVHSRHHFGARQREDFVAALAAVEILDRQFPRKLHALQGGAHGAVEDHDTAGDRFEEIPFRHRNRAP